VPIHVIGGTVGPSPEFTTQVESHNGVVRVALGGDLDMAAVRMLDTNLARVEQDGITAIVLDLRDLRFVDSSGLHAFLQAKRRSEANGHQLVLVGVPETMRRLLELTGTESLLDGQGTVGVLHQFTGGTSRLFARSRLNGDAGD
jgi:anti-anti-sigma factor